MKIKSTQPFSFSIFKGIILPLLLWLIFTPWSAELDLKTSQFFYNHDSFPSHPFWDWMYIYGLWPAWLLVALALAGLIFSFRAAYDKWRTPSLYLLLTHTIGSGIIIHAILKDHWGRPRPRQITEFGGYQSFRPYYKPNISHQPEPSKSFASGHASLGYYFFSLALMGAVYRSKLLYRLGLFLALAIGILLSITRIAQGGHFLSDTIASALIMWLVAWGLAYLLFEKNNSFYSSK